jgi:adenine-specific DNA-methyltransferase
MYYIGNKNKLLTFIDETLSGYIDRHGIKINKFIDLFSGTGSVSDHFNNIYEVISNDIMYYSFVFTKSLFLISKLSPEEVVEINDIITLLNNKNDYVTNGFFYQNYSEISGRTYFTDENSMKIDTIRKEINNYEKYKDILLSLLISAVCKISNTTGVFGAFLKKYKLSSLKKIQLEYIKQTNTNKKNNVFYNTDVLNFINFISGIDESIVYIDPPYNTRDYGSNYHILETLCLDDDPEIKGKTGLRVKKQGNCFYKKSTYRSYFYSIIAKCSSAKIMVISYSSTGLLSVADMEDILLKNNRTNIEIFKKEYKKYKSNTSGDNEKIYEYLIISTRS